MTSYRFLKIASIVKSTSGFGFSHGTSLVRRKATCVPNFDEISQSTAEIKPLPVSENGWPRY